MYKIQGNHRTRTNKAVLSGGYGTIYQSNVVRVCCIQQSRINYHLMKYAKDGILFFTTGEFSTKYVIISQEDKYNPSNTYKLTDQ